MKTSCLKWSFASVLGLLVALSAAAVDLKPADATPGGVAPNTVPRMQVPAYLQGALTADEFTDFMFFCAALRNAPETAADRARYDALRQEMIEINERLSGFQERKIEENPKMKAIERKIRQATPSPVSAAAQTPGLLRVASS